MSVDFYLWRLRAPPFGDELNRFGAVEYPPLSDIPRLAVIKQLSNVSVLVSTSTYVYKAML
jgi:hypothetical protein